MSTRLWFVLSVIVTASLLLAACTPDAALTRMPATSTPAPVQATTVSTTTAEPVQPIMPTAATTAAVQSDNASMKVGLVTHIGGVTDQAFNQLAWEGIQRASADMGFQAKVIESTQPTDYETNIDALAAEGYDVVITVGSVMSDATALKARQYPGVKFAIIDYVSTDGGLPNVTSLVFAEDQLGFLAGVLAGGMSGSGFVCSVSSMKTPASDRSVRSFFEGAIWQAGEEVQFMNNYINLQTSDSNVPNSIDATNGKQTAQRLIDAGCDVVFAVAADGALLAAKENNVMAIGFDVDQYNTTPEAQAALMSSTQKKVDVAVYNYLKTVDDGSVKGGMSIGTLQNGSIGLAPFHDWDSRVPADLKAQIQNASNGIMNGSIMLDPQ